MKKRGLSRPGALQMVASGILMILAALGPIFLAATSSSHEWLVMFNGLPALGLFLAGIGVLFLYVIGFLRYCTDKGYSKWLGFWLLLANVFGFIVLLLLPDLNTIKMTERRPATKVPEVSGSGGND